MNKKALKHAKLHRDLAKREVERRLKKLTEVARRGGNADSLRHHRTELTKTEIELARWELVVSDMVDEMYLDSW